MPFHAKPKMLRLKRFATGILCHPMIGRILGRLFRKTIPSRGFRIRVPDQGNPIINAMLFWGIYESAEIRFVKRYLMNSLDVVELGSSIGAVSCEIARKLKGERKLICVEANTQLIELLRHNIGKNNARCHRLHIECGAIDYSGSPDTTLILGQSNVDSRVANGLAESGKANKVPSTTLSRIIRTQNLQQFSLVSDIEGAEVGLFLEDSNALKGCVQMIIELHEVTYKGRRYGIGDIVNLIVSSTHFRLRDAYGAVYFFDTKDCHNANPNR